MLAGNLLAMTDYAILCKLVASSLSGRQSQDTPAKGQEKGRGGQQCDKGTGMLTSEVGLGTAGTYPARGTMGASAEHTLQVTPAPEQEGAGVFTHHFPSDTGRELLWGTGGFPAWLACGWSGHVTLWPSEKSLGQSNMEADSRKDPEVTGREATTFTTLWPRTSPLFRHKQALRF